MQYPLAAAQRSSDRCLRGTDGGGGGAEPPPYVGGAKVGHSHRTQECEQDERGVCVCVCERGWDMLVGGGVKGGTGVCCDNRESTRARQKGRGGGVGQSGVTQGK